MRSRGVEKQSTSFYFPHQPAGIAQYSSIAHLEGGLRNGLEEIAHNAGIMCSFRLVKGDHGGGLRFPVGLRGQLEGEPIF